MVLIVPACGTSVVVPVVVPVPVAPVAVWVANPIPVAVSPISGTLTIAITNTVAVALTVTVTVAVSLADTVVSIIRSTIRGQQALGHAGLAEVALPFGNGLATVGFVRVVLGAAAGPCWTSTGAMRPLTPTLTVIRISTVSAPPLTLCFVFLLLKPAGMLVKRAATGLFGCHGLELLTLGQTRSDLLVSISDQNWGL